MAGPGGDGGSVVRLFYRTDWPRCLVHFCRVGGSEWTDLPLEAVQGAPDWRTAVLDAPGGADFVLRNDAGDQWDNPPAGSGGDNYRATAAGVWVLRDGQLWRASAGPPLLVVSDLDHTLLGHDLDQDNAILAEFLALWLGRYAFTGSRLVYSTGRNKADALQVLVERQMPRPALVICGVGTEVYEVPEDLPLLGGDWARDPDRITPNAGWQRTMTETFDRGATEAILKERFPRFEMRGGPDSDPFRIPTAYEVDEAFPVALEQVRSELGPTVEVIASGGAEWKLVDFCSARAGKLKALEFAMERLSFAPERTLACGDSGNDELMYRCPRCRCVAVGNALPELMAMLRSKAKEGPAAVEKGRVFETVSSSQVLYAERNVAGGVVEALSRFWPEAA